MVRWKTGLDLTQYDNGFFNWTMTYKTDADVYMPYRHLLGHYYRTIAKGKVHVDRILEQKTKLAVSVALVTDFVLKDGYWSFIIITISRSCDLHFIFMCCVDGCMNSVILKIKCGSCCNHWMDAVVKWAMHLLRTLIRVLDLIGFNQLTP